MLNAWDVLSQLTGKPRVVHVMVHLHICSVVMGSGSAVGWGTSRRVAGSIPDDVIGTFHGHNPSGGTMALELTQPLTEWRPVTTLPPSCADCQEIWAPQPPGTLRACARFALPCLLLITHFSLGCYMSLQNASSTEMRRYSQGHDIRSSWFVHLTLRPPLPSGPLGMFRRKL